MLVERAIEKPHAQPNGIHARKGLQGTLLHLPKVLPWRVRVREELRHAGFVLPFPEVLDVAGRMVKGFVVPHWAAAVLLGAILTAAGFMYRSFSQELKLASDEQRAQRDMLIEMKTELRLSKEHDTEYRSEFKETLALQQVYMNHIINLLSPEQRRELEQRVKSNQQ